jgi:hypothetical protein
MRAALTIAVFSSLAATTLTAAAQAPARPVQPTAPAQKTEPARPAAEPKKTEPNTEPKNTGRAARQRHRGRMVRHRHESICSIINGWRAFNNPYDPKGYFYTGRVCCCG